MSDLRVAIIQSKQFWEDKSANLDHFDKHLKSIKKGETDLIILPEMFNTSFSMKTTELAEKMDGRSSLWLQRKAEELDSTLAATLIIEEENKFYNRLVVVNSKGVIAHYDKRHLFRIANENDHFTAGDNRQIVNIKGWNILLQVCYDLRFPVFSRNKSLENGTEYDLVFYPANWPEKRNMVWKNLLVSRAIENQAYCIGVNRVGQDGNDISYSGDSMCVDPWGQIQHQCTEKVEEVKILTLKKGVIEDINTRFPAFKDAD
jgi:omega-amidase